MDLAAQQAALFARFERLGITTKTYDHPAFFTVEEGRVYKTSMPGAHSKTLFVKDKKDNLFLIVCWADTKVELNALSKDIASSRVSFCAPEIMMDILGVTPGSVTPFALINDTARRVRVVVDQALSARSPNYFHPLINTQSTAIAPDDLLRFLRDLGYAPLVRAVGRASLAEG
jgi:Ala-tRNA(Pro) deacylase